jgi:hypothetical protein
LVFLLVLLIAFGVAVLPSARRDRWSAPWRSARRYRYSMRLVAPRTEWEIKRAAPEVVDGPLQRTRARRREIFVFLGSGVVFSAIVGIFSQRPAAWPTCGAFAALFFIYSGALLEADRRKVVRRVEARKRARADRAASAEERGFAEAV